MWFKTDELTDKSIIDLLHKFGYNKDNDITCYAKEFRLKNCSLVAYVEGIIGGLFIVKRRKYFGYIIIKSNKLTFYRQYDLSRSNLGEVLSLIEQNKGIIVDKGLHKKLKNKLFLEDI